MELKSSMKGSSRPPIPPEMPYLSKEGTLEQRCDWNALVRKYSQRLKKILRKNSGENDMDMSDAMMKRRSQVLVDYIPKIIERYQDVPGYEPEHRDDTGETFVHFNFIPVTTYNYIEDQAYLLLAASIWILDEILFTGDLEKRKQLFRLLPRDECDLDEIWNAPDFWHTNYEDDLISSVQYVLHCRNRDIGGYEVENDTKRLFTSSLIAQDGQHADVPSREAYEQLMELIPKESIDRAVAYFEELFWLWTDRFFDCIAPLDAAIRQSTDKVNALAKEYNQQRAELKEATKEMMEQRETKKQQTKPPAFNPLLANPVPQMPDFFKKQDFASPVNLFPREPLRGTAPGDAAQRVFSITDRLMNIADRHSEAMEKLSELEAKKSDFGVDMLRMGCLRDHQCREKYGDEVADRMKPLKITRPFEVCFALLWLIENGSDLPWLYGCGCGLMQEVVESLPWGIFHYREIHDPVWNPEDEEEEAEQLSFLEDVPKKEQTVKPSAIPEWYERKFIPNEDESFRFNRSMAQIVYEETGCILPRDMHKYDIRQKAVKRYGVTGKDTTALLMLFSALGHAKRSERALNFDQALMEYWDDESTDEEKLRRAQKAAAKIKEEERPLTYEELAEKLKAEQENSKKLRSSLHEAEKNSREARKELAAVRENAALEHRELADLREVVFNAENDETEEPEESFDENLFPYEVQKETIVFGGHETWLKAIKPMLTGNIRFLDKDLNFDVNVIRNAELVWVQTNAISHSQYYKITDAARQCKKPVRYFSHASATKGALQIMNADSSNGGKLI